MSTWADCIYMNPTRHTNTPLLWVTPLQNYKMLAKTLTHSTSMSDSCLVWCSVNHQQVALWSLQGARDSSSASVPQRSRSDCLFVCLFVCVCVCTHACACDSARGRPECARVNNRQKKIFKKYIYSARFSARPSRALNWQMKRRSLRVGLRLSPTRKKKKYSLVTKLYFFFFFQIRGY